MTKEKLIQKYELENKNILKRRPDLNMNGDFTPDGIKVFCNTGFIADISKVNETLIKQNEILEAKIIRLISENRELNEQLLIHSISNWVAISSTKQPEIMTDVIVKYKDGRKEVAFFDGDRRFYIEKDDRDITEIIIEWHKLP